ncbi:MAG: hypothetical protein OEY29_15335 [Gammaproteobacteria bacterium]|nr:hypothetical protein [Gammaproteobacteria bacterium]
MKKLLLLLILPVFFSAGCSMKMPMNPAEFRQMVPESMFGKKDSYTVNRSLSKITKTFKQKSDKCLRKSIERTSCQSNGYGTTCHKTINHYNPKIKLTKNKMEFTIQTSVEGNVIILGGDPPKGGMYQLVADITAVGKNKSQVDVYYGWAGSDMFVSAIKNWANGKTRGCPDLTQN